MVTPASHDRGDDNAVFNIGTAARRSGLSVTTIRTWEDRYGAVVPERDDSGRRLYSNHQIAQLTWLRRQVEGGLQAAEAHRLLDLNPVAPEDEGSAAGPVEGAPWMAVASWIEGERPWLESMLEDLGRGLGAVAAGVGPIIANPLYGDVLSVTVRALLSEEPDPLAPLAAGPLGDFPGLADSLARGQVATIPGSELDVSSDTVVVAPISITGSVSGAVVIVCPCQGDAEALVGQAARVIEARIDADRARSAFARLLG